MTIVEPFAGAAGYATRYADRNVILIEKYHVIAEIWRYLIAVKASEIMSIPTGIKCVDDLPTWVPVPARSLIGWWLNNATVSPRKRLSSGRVRLAAKGLRLEGWTDAARHRVASQVDRIRHWKCIEGDYTDAPQCEATWFVDPPYNNKAGSLYVKNKIDSSALSMWCQSRQGQVIVCENEGAAWLPFVPFGKCKAQNGKMSSEVVWTTETQ